MEQSICPIYQVIPLFIILAKICYHSIDRDSTSLVFVLTIHNIVPCLLLPSSSSPSPSSSRHPSLSLSLIYICMYVCIRQTMLFTVIDLQILEFVVAVMKLLGNTDNGGFDSLFSSILEFKVLFSQPPSYKDELRKILYVVVFMAFLNTNGSIVSFEKKKG